MSKILCFLFFLKGIIFLNGQSLNREMIWGVVQEGSRLEIE